MRKTSLLTILFPDKTRPKSVSLTEMLRKLEDEEVDLMEFLSEDADKLKLNSPRLQPSSFVQGDNRSTETESDPGIVFLRRSRSFSANSPDKFQIGPQKSSHLASTNTSLDSKTDMEMETEEEMDSSDVRVRRTLRSSQGNLPSLNRALSQTMTRPVSLHSMDSGEIGLSKSFSEPSSPAALDLIAAKTESSTPSSSTSSTPSSSTSSTTPFKTDSNVTTSGSGDLTPTKSERERVLEQRAALAEKKAKLLKQLKEQAEKDIKTRDFAFSVKDPRHWGGQ